MLKLGLALLVFIFQAAMWTSAHYIKQKEGMYILSDADFDRVISDNNYVFVQFVSPWCKKCEDLEEDFINAGRTLANHSTPVVFGKIDAHTNQNVKEKYKITSYPTFLFFTNGQPQPYYGRKSSFNDFYYWVFKKVEGAVKPISNFIQLQAEIEVHDIVVLYFGSSTIQQYQKMYEIIAKRYDKAFFLRAPAGSDLENHFNVTNLPTAILFRHFENNQVQFNQQWSAQNFERWLVQQSVPSVFEYSQEFEHHVFIHKHPTLFLFRDGKKDEDRELELRLRVIAQELKLMEPQFQEVLFAVSDLSSPAQKKVTDMVGIGRSHFPLVALISPAPLSWEKFIFNEKDLSESLTLDKVAEFLTLHKQGSLVRHLRAEDNLNQVALNQSVYVIKGNEQLKEFIQQSEKDVVVLFHAHFSNQSHKLMPLYYELAASLEHIKERLVFGKIDVTKNDLDFQVLTYPTVYLFRRGNKEEPTKFLGQMTKDKLEDFLETYSEAYQENRDRTTNKVKQTYTDDL